MHAGSEIGEHIIRVPRSTSELFTEADVAAVADFILGFGFELVVDSF